MRRQRHHRCEEDRSGWQIDRNDGSEEGKVSDTLSHWTISEPSAALRTALSHALDGERIVNRIMILLLTAIVLGTSSGCGGMSDKEKNKNHGLDRPRSTAAAD